MSLNLIDYALQLAAGTVVVIDHVSEEIAAERYETCMSCEYRDAERDKCKVCKCFLQLKTKSHTNRTAKRPFGEVTHCPLGKWNDTEIANHYRSLDGQTALV